MSNDEELRVSLLSILRIGLLRIRVLGWRGSAEACAIEADHLHNLPEIIREVRLDLVIHYFNISRPEFIKQAADTGEFEPQWTKIGTILNEIRATPGAPGPDSRTWQSTNPTRPR